MLMIQAEAQLFDQFGDNGYTIISNCDTYVYLGGNDIKTAKAVSERSNIPLHRVLNMPIETNWVFRRGSEPVNGINYDIDALLKKYDLLEEEVR